MILTRIFTFIITGMHDGECSVKLSEQVPSLIRLIVNSLEAGDVYGAKYGTENFYTDPGLSIPLLFLDSISF